MSVSACALTSDNQMCSAAMCSASSRASPMRILPLSQSTTTALTVLGECAPLPFQLDETAGEEARLRHRYLDLRRENGPGAALYGWAWRQA